MIVDAISGRAALQRYVAYEGRIAALSADGAHVTLDEYDGGLHAWGPCAWMPRGAAAPARGDRCLVVFSDVGEPWVVAWTAAAPPRWAAPVLAPNWTASGPPAPLGSFKDGAGTVWLRGTVTRAAGAGGAAAGATALTLPPGHRPATPLTFAVWRGTAAAQLTIGTDGAVVLNSATAASETWPLGGVAFPTEA